MHNKIQPYDHELVVRDSWWLKCPMYDFKMFCFPAFNCIVSAKIKFFRNVSFLVSKPFFWNHIAISQIGTFLYDKKT